MTAIPFVAFGLGVIARVFIPYLREWLDSRAPFDWRFVVGQLLGALVALIPMLASAEWLGGIAGLTWPAAVAYGWAAADIGREVDKWARRWRRPDDEPNVR